MKIEVQIKIFFKNRESNKNWLVLTISAILSDFVSLINP